MSSTSEKVYFKDFRSLTLKKDGGRNEWSLRTEFAGRVSIRISADNTISVSIMGPHAESAEVRGNREFGFTAEPGMEFRVTAVNEQRGILGKDADVNIEIEMRGDINAIDLMDKIKNYNQMLTENPDFFTVINDGVQNTITQVAEKGVWGKLSGEHKSIITELTKTVKKLEE